MIRDYLHTLQQHKKIIAFGFLAAFFTNFGQTFFIGLYGDEFRSHFRLSNTDFGAIYSGVTLCSALAMLALGHLIDKVPLRLYATVICLALALGCTLIAQATGITLFVVGLWLVRFFSHGLLGHMSNTATARYVKEGRARGLSLANMGYPLGEILFPLMVTALFATLSWQSGWQIYGLIYAGLALPLFFWLARDFTLELHIETQSQKEDKKLGEVLKEGDFWLILLTTMFMPFFLTGIFFHQQWLMGALELPATLFALTLVFYGIARAFSNLIAGYLIDRAGAEMMMKLFLIPCMVATLIFAFLPSTVTLVLFMIASSVTVGTLGPLKGTFLAERYGTKHLGAIKSVLASSMVFSTALSPVLFGWLIDATQSALLPFHLGWIVASFCIVALVKYL
jgi:MFS family permease